MYRVRDCELTGRAQCLAERSTTQFQLCLSPDLEVNIDARRLHYTRYISPPHSHGLNYIPKSRRN